MLEKIKNLLLPPWKLEQKEHQKKIKEFTERTEHPDFQKRVAEIINKFGLGEVNRYSVGYIEDNPFPSKYFLRLDSRSSNSFHIEQVIENNKPPFVICEPSGLDIDAVGLYGLVEIPADEEIRISERTLITGYGINNLLKKLGYKELRSQESDITVYELGQNQDKSLLTAHFKPEWKFE